MDYAERYPRWQQLSLELPTENAVPQREQGIPCREWSISKSLKKKQKKNVAKQHFVNLNLLIQDSKTLLELNQNKQKKVNEIRSLLISHFGISLNPKDLLDFNE